MRGVGVVLALGVFGLAMAAEPVPKGPSPHINVYFPKGFDDKVWQKAAFEKVMKGWHPKAVIKPGAKIVLITTIAKDGKIEGARENLLSGSADWDRAAMDAIRAASPLPPLPKSWAYPTLEVHWHFEE